MEPSMKKRRLAPKEPQQPQSSHSPSFPHDQQPLPPQHFQPSAAVTTASASASASGQDAPSNPQRNDFESFARHLQDAAMMIYNQTHHSPYSSVSVLMLRWEEDSLVDQDMTALEHLFQDRFGYHTERWNIPTVANPSIKLGVQIASFLEKARQDHLLIIYYAGHSYVHADGQLYWASNTEENAAKLKWGGVKCLFEDSQSDILLLLDSCAVQDAPMAGSQGAKQALAACAADKNPRDAGSRSFTAHLVDSLTTLGTGKAFTVNQLFDELTISKQQEIAKNSLLSNGNSKTASHDVLPISFSLTPGKSQGLSMAPLRSKNNSAEGEAAHIESAIGASVAELTFEEPRALVCTTFVGDASPDMSSFNQWLHNAPAVAPKITVEGMFIGPPTILIISMPQSVWNVVQNEKVCLFLGHISTHNITHLYQSLIGSVSKEVEDGKILLEARQAASVHRNHLIPNTPRRLDVAAHLSGVNSGGFRAAAAMAAATATSGGGDPKDIVEESAEMQEAAEQLKALSHVRHLSDGSPATAERTLAPLVDSAMDIRQDETGSSPDANDSMMDITQYSADFNSPNRPHKRRTLLKQRPNQETSCVLCSHAPFKDSSSLRKHVAAAHTRPFPCAFSFAGCTSTFGSKNEWKRHIASQHLCLQYYRCSSCPTNSNEGKGNEFNRKDLFTQHLRRMHAPFAIKKALTKGDNKLQLEWETHVKKMQITCLVTRRKPPQRSACPRPDCQSIFEGSNSWDEWTEHVGRHMEKGEAQRMGVDRLLAKWALEEGIIEGKGDGEYRLCTSTGMLEKEIAASTPTRTTTFQPSHENEKQDAEEQAVMDALQADRMVVDE